MSDAANRIQAINQDLLQALARLEEVLSHVDAGTFPPALRVVISNNVIVAFISTMEEALRNVFGEYIHILEQATPNYEFLRERLRASNLEAAIKLLTETRRESDWSQAKSISDALSRCYSGTGGYALFRQKITYNDGNFRSKQLTDTSQRAGIETIWRLVADDPQIENYIGEANLETRTNRLIQLWNDLFDERDKVVHRISQASGWGSQRIRDGIEVSKLVFSRVCICLTSDADAFIEAVALRTAHANS